MASGLRFCGSLCGRFVAVFGAEEGRSLEKLDEAGDHSADGEALIVKRLELRFGDVAFVQRDIELRTHFSRGTLGDGQRLEEFAISIPFESFGNVRSDRDRRTTDLIAQGKVTRKLARPRSPINRASQLTPQFPSFDVFKSRDCHREI